MKKFVIVFTLMLLMTPLYVLAQSAPSTETNTPCTLQAVKDAKQNNKDKYAELPRCVNRIYVWSLGVGALLALLMMVYGGFQYMTSSGNAEMASSGTEKIWGAVIGLALLFGAYLLLRTINPDLVNFRSPGACLDNPSLCGTPTPPPPGPRN